MTMIRALEEHRHLIFTLSVHDFRSQYLGSVLGFFWSLIKPLVLIGVYALVFSWVVTPTTSGQGKPLNFGLYIFAGMLPWLAIQESLQRGTTVFVDQSHLIRHHAIPLYLIPFHIVLSATVSEIMALMVFLLIKGLIDQNITSYCVLIMALIPIQIIFCYGMALMVATLTVFLRDFSHLTTTILFVWFFTSPIVFPLESLPAYLQRIIWFNPLTGLTEIYRDLLLVGRLPAVPAVASFLFFTVLSMVVGLSFYYKSRKEIVDWV